jgi:hypothetical protein
MAIDKPSVTVEVTTAIAASFRVGRTVDRRGICLTFFCEAVEGIPPVEMQSVVLSLEDASLLSETLAEGVFEARIGLIRQQRDDAS